MLTAVKKTEEDTKMKKLLALLLTLTLLLCCGCGSKSEMATDASAPLYAGGASPAGPAAEPAPEPVEENGFAAEAEVPYEPQMEEVLDAPAGEGEEPDVPDPTQKLIYRANMSVETLDFDAAVSGLERLASGLGGFVELSEVWGDASWQPDGSTRVVDRHASYVLRVPSNRFHEAVGLVGNLGSVVSSGSSVENITSQFTDQEARKHSLEVQEERLLAMLEKAEDVDTLVILESRLSEVRYEIESIERQLRNWQQQVDYSTVSVDLREVAAYTPTAAVRRSFGERLSTAFSDGWSSFVNGLEYFTIGLAEALPGLVLFVVLAGAVVFAALAIVRKTRKKRAARQRAAEEAARREGDKND